MSKGYKSQLFQIRKLSIEIPYMSLCEEANFIFLNEKERIFLFYVFQVGKEEMIQCPTRKKRKRKKEKKEKEEEEDR